MWIDWVVTTVAVAALGYGLFSIIFKRHIRLSMVDNEDFRSSAALLHTQFGRARLRLDRKLIEAKRLDVFSRLERRNRILAQLEEEKEANVTVSEEGKPLSTIEILRQRRLSREQSLAGSESFDN
ncbi:MAG: hypothetical protein CMB64_07275 [Euryarchaeota archaeon]|nr:hypothetical protein [Euryarchaeota archaeon]|tara:strand:+ start:280 stop:654 length:375 start_codon:yes stop_codon:yes gene_type:complete